MPPSSDQTQRMLFELMSSAKSRHYKADLAKAIKDLRGDGKDNERVLKKKKKSMEHVIFPDNVLDILFHIAKAMTRMYTLQSLESLATTTVKHSCHE